MIRLGCAPSQDEWATVLSTCTMTIPDATVDLPAEGVAGGACPG